MTAARFDFPVTAFETRVLTITCLGADETEVDLTGCTAVMEYRDDADDPDALAVWTIAIEGGTITATLAAAESGKLQGHQSVKYDVFIVDADDIAERLLYGVSPVTSAFSRPLS